MTYYSQNYAGTLGSSLVSNIEISSSLHKFIYCYVCVKSYGARPFNMKGVVISHCTGD